MVQEAAAVGEEEEAEEQPLQRELPQPQPLPRSTRRSWLRSCVRRGLWENRMRLTREESLLPVSSSAPPSFIDHLDVCEYFSFLQIHLVVLVLGVRKQNAR